MNIQTVRSNSPQGQPCIQALRHRFAAESDSGCREAVTAILARIRHAGAIFLGPWTPEAAGDYVAGPNPVLPTMGTARISSALGVETFLKKSSIISSSRQALEADSVHIRRLTALAGLTAHGNAVAVRVDA